MLNFVESYAHISMFKIFLLMHLISIGIGIYYEWGFFAHGIIFICFIVFYIAAIASFKEEVEGHFFKYLFNSKLSLKHLKELKDLITTHNGEFKFFNTKIKTRELEMELKKLKSPTLRYRQLYKTLVKIEQKKCASKKTLEDRESYEIIKELIGEK